ncbi:MAG: FdhF/YdeP family oxidoreductase [Gammaproteobacteria bacterium]|nr:FdhF/YdeP family oxidoreductase [Gammaproteobacteria bacterium]
MAIPGKKPVISEPPESAAGPAAVKSVLSHLNDKTGLASGAASLLKMNQPGGFDCPGCAWPEETEHRKRLEFCENGAKAFADEATRRRVAPEFFAHYSLSELQEKSGQWLNEQGRLTQPMVKKPGADNYVPITWFSACELIARHLNALDDPNEAAFYTSGRTSNEAAFLWQLFVRAYGTNNMPDCSNMCHESSGTAMTQVIGSGKGTVRLEDFDHANAIFVLGQNPGSNHPRMLAALERAKAKGAKIVTVNPLNEPGSRNFRNPQKLSGWTGKGTDLTDLHVPVRVNGDVAFLKGLCKALLEAETANKGHVLDREFIKQYTTGFEDFAADVASTSWQSIEEGSGVGEAVIREAAEIAIKAHTTICCWAMGLTQHVNAVANIQEVINFLMLRGNLGKQGAGACPVRGHSNVQGDRTMGVWEKPTPDFLERLGAEFKFDPPQAHGYDTIECLRAMDAGKVKVFLAMGGNFAAATPDSDFVEQALRKVDLTVQISTKLNRSHLITGETALILPVLGRTETDRQPDGEQFVTVENSMGVVTRSQGRLRPASEFLKSEVRVVAEIAEAVVGPRSTIKWRFLADDYHRIRDHIGKVVSGLSSFNDRLYDDGQIELPHAVRDAREFATASGKAEFTVHPIAEPGTDPGHYMMTTIRSHDQFNTTVYSQNDRYRGISESRWVVFMSEADMAELKLEAGDAVDLDSSSDSSERRLEALSVVPYRIPRGCIATYYPEANPLIPFDAVATGANTPAYKSVPVRIIKA